MQRHLAGAGTAGYKRPMRRTLRLIGAPARPFDKLGIARGWGLILLLPLLAFGAYAAYWWIAAGRIAQEFDLWAQHARTEKLEISWRQLRVTGFPVAFRLELRRVSFRYAALRPAPILDIPVLSGSARPWDPVDWRLMARRGLTAEIAGAGGRTPIRLAARSASGAVAVAPAGGAAIWFTLGNATAAQNEHVEIGLADAWVVLPPRPANAHGDARRYDRRSVGRGDGQRRIAARAVAQGGRRLARRRRRRRTRPSPPALGRSRRNRRRHDDARSGSAAGRRVFRSDRGL
jgi:hypothetical protein